MKRMLFLLMTLIIIMTVSACQKQTDTAKWKPISSVKKNSMGNNTNPVISPHIQKLWLNNNIAGATETITGKNDGKTYKAGENFDFIVDGDKAYFTIFDINDVDGDIPIEKWFYLKDLSEKPIKGGER